MPLTSSDQAVDPWQDKSSARLGREDIVVFLSFVSRRLASSDQKIDFFLLGGGALVLLGLRDDTADIDFYAQGVAAKKTIVDTASDLRHIWHTAQRPSIKLHSGVSRYLAPMSLRHSKQGFDLFPPTDANKPQGLNLYVANAELLLMTKLIERFPRPKDVADIWNLCGHLGLPRDEENRFKNALKEFWQQNRKILPVVDVGNTLHSISIKAADVWAGIKVAHGVISPTRSQDVQYSKPLIGPEWIP